MFQGFISRRQTAGGGRIFSPSSILSLLVHFALLLVHFFAIQTSLRLVLTLSWALTPTVLESKANLKLYNLILELYSITLSGIHTETLYLRGGKVERP